MEPALDARFDRFARALKLHRASLSFAPILGNIAALAPIFVLGKELVRCLKICPACRLWLSR
jgi:hypothetical protein